MEIRHDGQVLDEPYVVTVKVACRGALDIAANAFGGAPLELHFGTPVVALLDGSSHAGRPAVREPAVTVVDTALHVAPALLTRQHRLRYIVMLDGVPKFRPVGDLVDVTVRLEAPPTSTPMAMKVVAAFLLLPAIILAIVNLVKPNADLLNTQMLLIIGAAITLAILEKTLKVRSRK